MISNTYMISNAYMECASLLALSPGSLLPVCRKLQHSKTEE